MYPSASGPPGPFSRAVAGAAEGAGYRFGATVGTAAGWLLGFALATAIFLIPIVVGGAWLSEQGWSRAVFPGPGSSVTRFVLAVTTATIIIPGSLASLAFLVDSRLRWTALARPLRFAAVLAVPVVFALILQSAFGDATRLPS